VPADELAPGQHDGQVVLHPARAAGHAPAAEQAFVEDALQVPVGEDVRGVGLLAQQAVAAARADALLERFAVDRAGVQAGAAFDAFAGLVQEARPARRFHVLAHCGVPS